MAASISSLKIKTTKDISIPYILNGELYEILTQEGENVTVKCCSCPSDRVYRGSVRSTGNFHMHIKRRHPELLAKLHEMKVGSLLERRERLLKAKKIALRGRIKKEESTSREIQGNQRMPSQNANAPCPIDYSRQDESDDSEDPPMLNTSPSAIEREPNVIITTEVHCDRDVNMGVLPTPIYFSAVKQEVVIPANDHAMDLSIPSKRNENPIELQVSNLRWDEVLQRVESSLKDIQHEMRTRNQIETNRIFLDLAKFKYLHPGFHYQS